MDYISFAEILKGDGSKKGAQERREFEVNVEKAYLKENRVACEISHRSHKGFKNG